MASDHPADQTLRGFCLGEIAGNLAKSVADHLENCAPCRKRAESMAIGGFSPSASGKLAARTVSGASLSGGANPSVATSDFPNLPDYEFLRKLGGGGMGVVYLARNTITDRTEALKVLSSHLIDHPSAMERFLREIQAAVRLDHRNIVRAYTAIRSDEGLILVMEYVEGEDLFERVERKGPLSVGEACAFAFHAALGLQHAHEKGMVHRDIKPHNLILDVKGGKGVVKILDFGLAKVSSEGPIDGGITRHGAVLGTADYIAPEQIRNAKEADIRADIYSLGCTLYYMLNGAPPFAGMNSLYDIFQAHHSQDAKSLSAIRKDVPVELAALIGKMMAKTAEGRFQTPGEAAVALRKFCQPSTGATTSPAAEIANHPPAKPTPTTRAATLIQDEASVVAPRRASTIVQDATARPDRRVTIDESAQRPARDRRVTINESPRRPVFDRLMTVDESFETRNPLPDAAPTEANTQKRRIVVFAAAGALAASLVLGGVFAFVGSSKSDKPAVAGTASGKDLIAVAKAPETPVAAPKETKSVLTELVSKPPAEPEAAKPDSGITGNDEMKPGVEDAAKPEEPAPDEPQKSEVPQVAPLVPPKDTGPLEIDYATVAASPEIYLGKTVTPDGYWKVATQISDDNREIRGYAALFIKNQDDATICDALAKPSPKFPLHVVLDPEFAKNFKRFLTAQKQHVKISPIPGPQIIPTLEIRKIDETFVAVIVAMEFVTATNAGLVASGTKAGAYEICHIDDSGVKTLDAADTEDYFDQLGGKKLQGRLGHKKVMDKRNTDYRKRKAENNENIKRFSNKLQNDMQQDKMQKEQADREFNRRMGIIK